MHPFQVHTCNMKLPLHFLQFVRKHLLLFLHRILSKYVVLLFLPSSYISLTISIMMNKSCFISSSKTLVKKEEFEDSLVGVFIIPLNKRTSNKINKELIQQPFETNLLCFKDCFEVLWPSALLPSCPLLDLAINSFPFTSVTQKIVSLQQAYNQSDNQSLTAQTPFRQAIFALSIKRSDITFFLV